MAPRLRSGPIFLDVRSIACVGSSCEGSQPHRRDTMKPLGISPLSSDETNIGKGVNKCLSRLLPPNLDSLFSSLHNRRLLRLDVCRGRLVRPSSSRYGFDYSALSRVWPLLLRLRLTFFMVAFGRQKPRLPKTNSPSKDAPSAQRGVRLRRAGRP